MKKLLSLALAAALSLGAATAQDAKTPLEEVNFVEAYANDDQFPGADATDVKAMCKRLTNEYLRLDYRLALINEAGARTQGNRTDEFLMQMGKKGRENDFLKTAKADMIICYAYLIAMDNFKNVEKADRLAQRAVSKDNKSQAVKMIAALIKAQVHFAAGKKDLAFRAIDDVRKNKQLSKDKLPDAAAQIFYDYADKNLK